MKWYNQSIEIKRREKKRKKGIYEWTHIFGWAINCAWTFAFDWEISVRYHVLCGRFSHSCVHVLCNAFRYQSDSSHNRFEFVYFLSSSVPVVERLWLWISPPSMKSSSLNAVQTVCHKHNPNPEWNTHKMSAHIKYAYLNKTAIRFQFLFHHLSTADYTNEPCCCCVSRFAFFFASSWDFGLFFFFFWPKYISRARVRSFARRRSACVHAEIYIYV